jgi:uncharacterized membrane protein
MSMLTDAKTLGGVGSILVVLSAVPSIGWVLGIAGFVMILVAINKVSQIVKENKIYSNMLTAVILGVIAIAIGSFSVIGTAVHVLQLGSFVGTKFVFAHGIAPSDLLGLVAGIVGGLLAVWAFLVASAVYVRRSYNLMASRLNVKRFETAGMLYLIGAATAIIGVGFIVLLAAEIVLAVAFFSLEERPAVLETAQKQTVTS